MVYTGEEFIPHLMDDLADRMTETALTGEVDKFVVFRIVGFEPSGDDRRDDFYYFLEYLPDKYVMTCLSKVIPKLGRMKIGDGGHMNAAAVQRRFEIPGMYELFFENFEPCEKNKYEIIKFIILSESAQEILALAEKNGWFDDPGFLNKTIEFSAEAKTVGFTAWLLDCKHRLFGGGAKRKKPVPATAAYNYHNERKNR